MEWRCYLLWFIGWQLVFANSTTPMQINSNESNHKIKVPSLVNQTQLWHLRLGHMNIDRICRLVTSEHLSPLDVTALPVCEPCLEGKMTMRPFKAISYRAKVMLDLVHTNLCGPMSTTARGGYEYFISFIDLKVRVHIPDAPQVWSLWEIQRV